MKFVVTEMSSRPGTAYIRYDCACGCKPGVEYARGSDEVEHDQCCCGNVHFAGPDARRRLDEYISSRAAEDADLGGRSIHETSVPAPWGGDISVAYALPRTPRAH